MVTVSCQAHCNTLIVEPNRSLSWHENRLLIYLLGGFTMIVALFWTLMGAWLVLPLAGLEVAALAWALYYVSWKLSFRQVIRISDRDLVIEEGHYFPKRTWRMDRADTAVTVEQMRHPFDPLRITLFDRTQQKIVGDFLNRDDTDKLLTSLRSAGLRVRSHSIAAHVRA